ncbi:uncharacterized protein LOC111103751 [Crassostrea virginica]|uniref:Uncharacterized protein LOC111134906 n=1 Tax=Crassostrea virginica TaxID=6565 RepID=A0A8B8EJC8_CRAVI|nr:uncharacterized protein LOC111134906 [Crassostrea virginica]XP_022340153.1 uncharacterized protein LOC111134906 [Crassostrea virginica]XP_022340169.1 uncharacterized protein LOC111134910 [Crassostrea virginica]XP_022340170.1 uncharacterized protein LOC111134910 [Crassostrea virginica]XP_022340172.1 uncharacterized protein LOC111134910 [Crassostrea virginica]
MDLLNFLKKRNVPKPQLDKLLEDKIDSDALKYMTDTDLAEYLPAKGDRLALKAFCEKKPEGKKQRLLETLRQKMMLRSRRVGNEDTLDSEEKATSERNHLEGNKNAAKSSRKLELGWIHEGRQVRKKNGGGTRNVVFDKTATKKDILEKCKTLFFPNGKVKSLELKNLTFNILDFKETEFPDDLTVGEIYDQVKMGILRFYLSTNLKDITDSDENSLPDPELTLNKESSFQSASSLNTNTEPESFENMNACSSPLTMTPQDVTSSSMKFEPAAPSSSSITLTQDNSCLGLHVPGILIHTYDSVPAISFQTTSFDAIQDQQMEFVSADVENNLLYERLSPELHPKTLKVHRVNIIAEMVEYFKDKDILDTNIAFSFIGEAGSDQRGVSREVYSAFWTDFLTGEADGEESRVPAINTKWQEEEWNSVGRILLKGFTDHAVFPLKLNKAFTIALIHGEEHVSPEILLDSFMTYICHADRELLKQVMAEGVKTEIKEDFIDLLDRFGCKSVPTERGQIRSQIIQISHNQLIQKPKYALDKMKDICQGYLKTLFPSISTIEEMFQLKKPTAKRIINILVANPTSAEESKALGFLQQFLRAQNDDSLQKVLRFFTGADTMCVDKIDITFVNLSGFERRVIAHTCGPVIELPSTYQTYPEFRKEMEYQLSSEESFKMNIA